MIEAFSKHQKIDANTLSILKHRELMSVAKPGFEPATNITCHDIVVHIGKKIGMPVRVYRSPDIKGPYPTLFYIPGTGFIANAPHVTDAICGHLAEKSNCQVVMLNHRLAPENKHPAGYQDAYALFQFFMDDPDNYLSLDKAKIAIGGYSSGATFAALITIQAKQEGYKIAKQILMSPFVDFSRSLTDYKQFEDQDSVITNEFIDWVLELYVPEGVDYKDPSLSPYWQEDKNVNGLPWTDIIFTEFDRVRGGIHHFSLKLVNQGVYTSNQMIPKENHSFLWNRLDIVTMIAVQLKNSFALGSIPIMSSPPSCAECAALHGMFKVKNDNKKSCTYGVSEEQQDNQISLTRQHSKL